ncbi:MAG: acyl dehydratase, partial [Alphaproteobacteria bacterium]|nr:acyl dehydratase [Alphaproteobacteria bacterium]
LKPVYPGDTLSVETEIVEVRPSNSRPEFGSFKSNVAVFNQHDESVAKFTSIVLVERRPS